MKNVVQRNRCLYECAENGLTYTQVCRKLKESFFETVSHREWVLWEQYYYPLTRSNPIFKNEIINNNKTLSWVIRQLSERRTKTSLS